MWRGRIAMSNEAEQDEERRKARDSVTGPN
jgi:hypothetical protein